jgi:hypothetical protein
MRYKGLAYSYVRNTALLLRFRGKATCTSRTLRGVLSLQIFQAVA